MIKNIFIAFIISATVPLTGMKREGTEMLSQEPKRKKINDSFHLLLKMRNFEKLFQKLSDPTSNVDEIQDGLPFIGKLLNAIKEERKARTNLIHNSSDCLSKLVLPQTVRNLKEATDNIQELQKASIITAQHPSFKRDCVIGKKHILLFLAKNYREGEDIEFDTRRLDYSIQQIKNFADDSLNPLDPQWKEKYPDEMQSDDFQKCLVHACFAEKNKSEVIDIIKGFKKEDELRKQMNISIIGSCDTINPIHFDGRTPLHLIALRTSTKTCLNHPDMENMKYRNNTDALDFAARLVCYGANPNIAAESGSTALHYCANNVVDAFSDKSLAWIFIAHGASTDKINARGESFKSKAGDILTNKLLEATTNRDVKSLFDAATNDIICPHTALAQREMGLRQFRPSMDELCRSEVKQATEFALNYYND